MNLSIELPDPAYCKTQRNNIDWECLVYRASYYFYCEYAVDIGGACHCGHPNKEEYDQTYYYN